MVWKDVLGAEMTAGSAAAAILATGIGCFALGAVTLIARMAIAVNSALIFARPVGTVSGKIALSILLWLGSWMALDLLWRNRPVPVNLVLTIALVMIGFGVLTSFPPIVALVAR